MKKIVTLFIISIIVCFAIPFLLVKPGCSGEKQKLSGIRDTKKIKLLISSTGEIKEMSLNEYLKGVLIGEVPATYEMEALKAQAVVARTYTMYKLKNGGASHDGADMCDDINHCQAYKTKEYAFESWDDDSQMQKWEKISDAVDKTTNEVITYNNELINAFFHAHSGGKTEDVKYVWGRKEIPYLKSVDSYESYSFEDYKKIDKKDFIELMNSKYDNYNEKCDIVIKECTESGRVDKLMVGNIEMLGTDVRTLFGLRSTNFKVTYADEQIIFNTIGYGHGIGMSQEGANQMALDGKKYDEIIKHYYTSVEINNIE